MKKNLTRIFAFTIALLLMFSVTSFAHGGGTDGSGGHHDNQNASGLGSYHYHHGMGPHLHPNGICPYSSNNYNAKPSSKAITPIYKTYPNNRLTWTEIYNIQVSLKAGGFYYGKIDGVLGLDTFNAVKTFQKSKWMAADGLIGEKTKAKIASINSLKAYTPPKSIPVNIKQYPNNLLTWTEIYNIQVSLKAGGFYAGKINGIFNLDTFNAVKTYQKSKWMAADGLIGPKTKAAIATINDSKTVSPDIVRTETVTLSDGIYTGTTKNGIVDGYGEFVRTDGDYYYGYWKNGLRNGLGTYTWAGGDSYQGEWENGHLDGQGTYAWPEGDSYTGSFANDLLNGFGIYKYSDGSELRGNWIDGNFVD